MKALALLLALSAVAYAGPQADDDEDPLTKPAPKRETPPPKPDAPKKAPKPEPKKEKPAKVDKKPVEDDTDIPPPHKSPAKKDDKKTAKKPDKKPKADKSKPKSDFDDDVEAPAPKPDKEAKNKKPAKADKKPAKGKPVEDDLDVTAPKPDKTAKKTDKKPAKAEPVKTEPVKTEPVEIDMDVGVKTETAATPVAPLDEPAQPKGDDIAVVKTAPHRDRGFKHWTFRLGVAYVDPLSQSNPLELADVSGPASLAVSNGPIMGSGASVDSATIPAMIVGYRVTRKLSVETILGTPFTVHFNATGTLANQSLAPTALGIPTGVKPLGSDLGEAKAAPPTLTLVYSPWEGAAIQPYFGAGAAVLIAYDAKVTNPILTEVSQPDMHLSPAPGLVLQTGIEAPITKNIFARLDVKFIALMRADATVEHIQVKTPDLPLFDSVEVGTAKMSVWVNPLIIQAGVGTNF